MTRAVKVAISLTVAVIAGVLAAPAAQARDTEVITASFSPTPTITTQKAHVLDGLNAERARLGLAPLRTNTDLTAASQRWADHLADTGTCEHSSTVTTVAGGHQLGEVLFCSAAFSPSEQDGSQAVEGWMTSPAHRALVTDPEANSLGVGISAVLVHDPTLGDTFQYVYLAQTGQGPTPPPVLERRGRLVRR